MTDIMNDIIKTYRGVQITRPLMRIQLRAAIEAETGIAKWRFK